MTKTSQEHSMVSYIKKQRRTNHKDYQNCLFAYFLSHIELKKVIQALTDPSWIEVYRNKKDKRVIVGRNKARLVAQGHTQEDGIDYDEVFAPVSRIEAITFFLAYASFMGFIVYQMDVKSAFLYGTLEEEVYVCKPPSFEDPQFPDNVYKVEKALYGLHQAPRAWYETLSTYMLDNRFRRGIIDNTLFIKKDKCDILIDAQDVLDELYGGAHFLLRVTGHTSSTLIETNKALLKDEEVMDVDVHLYRSMIESLMYLTTSRPDIMFVVCVIMDSPFDMEAFSNSDYARASLDKKSTIREYVAAANYYGHVLWIQNQMLDYGFNFMNTKIYIDNESTICIVKNLVYHSKTKHIEIRNHFIRDSYEKRLIQVIKIHTDHNVTDLLTKAFDVCRDEFGVKTGSSKVNAARVQRAQKMRLLMILERKVLKFQERRMEFRIQQKERKSLKNEFESMFGQDKDANSNNTYRMFTTVSTAGSSYVNLGGSIPVNANTLPNGDLPTDSLMPDLEDTVYRNKKDKKGIVVRNKARLVAQGHPQEEGIDYDEVFALVARTEAIRDLPFDLEAFLDSDYARASLDRKSTTGSCQFLGKILISWKCKKQTVVANLTTKAEDEFGVKTGSSKVNAASIASQPQKTYIPRRTKRGQDTEIPQSSGPPKNVVDKVVCTGEDNRVVRAATTATRLKVVLESGNTIGSREDMMEHEIDLTDPVPQTPHDSPLSGGDINDNKDDIDDMIDEEMKNVKGDTANAGGAVNTATTRESGNINKTQSMTTLNEPSPMGTGSGSGPRSQDTTLRDTDTQTRFETASKQSHDPPLSKVNPSGSRKKNMEHQDDLRDFVPPTPHDSPLSRGHTPRSDEDCSTLRDQKATKESQKIRQEAKRKNSRDESLQDEAMKNVKGDTVNTGGAVNTATIGFSNASASITTADVSINKGKGIMPEPKKSPKIPRMAQIQLDEELAKRTHEENITEFEKRQSEIATAEEASKATINQELDDIQAMIKADEQRASRL
nr:hypothetical protein [Tanacetum cinerariifolium]